MAQQDSFDFDFDDAGTVLDEPPTLSVVEVVMRVNRVLNEGLGRGVWVRGEIHDFSVRGQHRYFSLVDDADTSADLRQRPKLSAALFGQAFQRMRAKLERAGLTLQDGLTVRMRGALELYGPTGRLTFKVSAVDPEFTLGNLALRRDLLLRQLTAEGIVGRNRQLDVSLVPLRIGVVTSRQADGWRDFQVNLTESGLGFQVLLAPVTVQGATAPLRVARGLHQLALRDDLDVIAVVRGGGSKSDLATFDHERVARAIGASPLPVITGIGHDADRTVADHVAHTALKTPTACAQFLIDRVRAFEHELHRCSVGVSNAAVRSMRTNTAQLQHDERRMVRSAAAVLTAASQRLVTSARHVGLATRGTLDSGSRQLDRDTHRLVQTADRTLHGASNHLDVLATRLDRRPRQVVTTERSRLDVLDARVRAVDPKHALSRGWTITTDHDGRVVRSVADAPPGTSLTTTLRDGRVRSTVTDVEEED